MEKQKVNLDGIVLVGMVTRTNNQNEMDPNTSKIGELAGSYWANQVANELKDRVNPGVTYAVYTDFENEEHGEYTYFIGEAVESFESLSKQDQAKFASIVIPAGTYQKFTTAPGKMPNIIIESWQKIWNMKPKDFEGKRTFLADFEIYDERASDLNNAVVDIYIGIKEE